MRNISTLFVSTGLGLFFWAKGAVVKVGMLNDREDNVFLSEVRLAVAAS